jgi:hypothetical protein
MRIAPNQSKACKKKKGLAMIKSRNQINKQLIFSILLGGYNQ